MIFLLSLLLRDNMPYLFIKKGCRKRDTDTDNLCIPSFAFLINLTDSKYIDNVYKNLSHNPLIYNTKKRILQYSLF